MSIRAAFSFLLFASCANIAFGQAPTIVNRAPERPINIAEPPPPRVDTDELPPISPKKSPGPMSLEACLNLGFQHQPLLDASRASLAAAQTGQRALEKMVFARFMAPELPIRKRQSCLGVTIAEAGLTQAEWDTRYSITRNFFTVQYIRSQKKVLDDVFGSLTKARARAKKLFDDGDVNIPITQLDIDNLDINIALVKGKQGQVRNGELKAFAALREAMGLGHDYPLEIADVALPPAVWEEKKTTGFKEEKDDKGKVTKTPVETITYHRYFQINKADLITAALANRGEMIQARTASDIVGLEVDAQSRIIGPKGTTFANGGDIHAKQAPQGVFNNEYRPGGFSIEMPNMLAGNKRDRMQRASDLHQQSLAVVEKAHNLVSLDVEAQYLKWQEAAEEVVNLKGIEKRAAALPGQAQNLAGKNFTSQAVIQANIQAILVRTQLNEQVHTHALALAGLERATAGAFRIYPIPAPAPPSAK
ncbi:MAG: TolC family protein [Planctomycetes bacterium]|nr:TolC family protein [Planctomycetota bacterium]